VFNISSASLWPNGAVGGRGHLVATWWLEELSKRLIPFVIDSALEIHTGIVAFRAQSHADICEWSLLTECRPEFLISISDIANFHRLYSTVQVFKPIWKSLRCVLLWFYGMNVVEKRLQLNAPFISYCLATLWQILCCKLKVSFPCLKDQKLPLTHPLQYSNMCKNMLLKKYKFK